MYSAAAAVGRVTVGDAASRLALAESLLSSDDAQDAARRGIDWLATYALVSHALVAFAEHGHRHLVVAASHGLPAMALNALAVSRDDEHHPLIKALNRLQPSRLTRRDTALPAPLEEGCHVVPLRSDDASTVYGMLLTGTDGPQIRADVLWAAGMLARAVERLPGQHTPADGRFGQERMLLYSIINAVTDPILLTDTEGKLIIANGHAEKLFAAPEDASEGWRRAVSLNNMLFSAALCTSTVSDRDLARHEVLLVDPLEGSDLLFELLSSRARDERQGTYVVSVLRNVTDLAHAKEEIEDSYRTLRTAQAVVRDERHRLELIIDSVPDPILVTDPEGSIVLMNEPAERLFEAPSGGDEAERAVRSNGAHLTTFVSNVLTRSGEQRYRGDMQLSDPATGRVLPVEGVAGTILSEHGELMWVVTILHDQTEAFEKARLYEQLKQAKGELELKVQEATAELATQNELLRRQHIALEQASALKSQFLANMSHEFRTPLNAILGYTHMLLNGVTGRMSDPQRKSLTRIDSNSRHLLALINDILDITRIEAGRMPLTLSTFGVPDLVREVMGELEPMIRRSELDVTTTFGRGLVPIRSDRPKVKQIVLNLLSNALKFTPEGSILIAAAYDGQRRTVSISVRDTGVGISREDQKNVFEDFRQLDASPAREYGGAGLGLAICRRLAHMLGGAIQLVSDLGRGSTFTLELPARLRR